MEDQERDTRIDEDVEGHGHHPHTKGANDEGDDVEGHGHHPHTKGANDEGDDVEGHSHHAAKGHTKLANDEGDDDVEGHVFKQAPNVPHTKA